MAKRASRNLAASLTYNQAIYGLQEGAISRKYIASQYTKLRNKMLNQIAEINRSSVSFRRSENIPSVPTWKELRKKSNEEIAHALADINYVIKNETIAKRTENASKILAGMRKVFPFANEQNWKQYADFFEWFRENAVNKLFDSVGSVVQEFLKDRAGKRAPSNQRSWARIFVKWLHDNGYEEQAQDVGAMFFVSYRR